MSGKRKNKKPFQLALSSKYFSILAGGGNGFQFAAGIGHDIGKSSKYRRQMGTSAGIGSSADRHQQLHMLGQIREYCRLYDRQTSLWAGMMNRATDNIVGPNFDFIPNTGDAELNKRVKEYIKIQMAAENADAAGVMDFKTILSTALRAIWNDGDVAMVKRTTGRLSMFEADQVISPRAGKGNRRIVQGIQLNEQNRPVNYWLQMRKTTGDTGMVKNFGNNPKAVAARHVIFPAFRKRFGQTRGIPVGAAILELFEKLQNYLEYEQIAAEMGSMITWGVKKGNPDNLNFSSTGKTDNPDATSTFEQVQKMEPGMIFDLLSEDEVELYNANRPGNTFEPYIITVCRLIGVGIGLPLELILLDFSRTNYSSARASMGEARRMFQVWQQFCQTYICDPWYRWQIARGIALGVLPAVDGIFKMRGQWPKWEYIDPLRSAKANEIERKGHVASRSEQIREKGNEPVEVDDEIEEDKKRLEERGISTGEEKNGGGDGGEGDNGEDDNPDAKDKEESEQQK